MGSEVNPKPHTERSRALGAQTWQEDGHEGAEVQNRVAYNRAEIVALILFAEVVQGEAEDLGVLDHLPRDVFAVQPIGQLGPGFGDVH